MYGTRRRVELGGLLYIRTKTGEASRWRTCNNKGWKKDTDSRHTDLGFSCLLIIRIVFAEYNYITSYYIQIHIYTQSHNNIWVYRYSTAII